MMKCDHPSTTACWEGATCKSCGAFRTDYAWGHAANRWFKGKAEAEFYKQHGRLPDPLPSERVASLEAALLDLHEYVSLACFDDWTPEAKSKSEALRKKLDDIRDLLRSASHE